MEKKKNFRLVCSIISVIIIMITIRIFLDKKVIFLKVPRFFFPVRLFAYPHQLVSVFSQTGSEVGVLLLCIIHCRQVFIIIIIIFNPVTLSVFGNRTTGDEGTDYYFFLLKKKVEVNLMNIRNITYFYTNILNKQRLLFLIYV